MSILLPITNAGMTRFHECFFLFLLILARCDCYQIDVAGELSFDLRISDVAPYERARDEINLKLKNIISKADKKDVTQTDRGETVEDPKQVYYRHETGQGRVTVAPIVECLYQYPEVQQLKAMLSNMMNELTKVFTRVHKQLRKDDGRRHEGHETRFRVVPKKNTDFFEDIFTNMTKDYSQFYNSTTIRVARTLENPCDNQEELKKTWKELLSNSLDCIRKASLLCFEECLRSYNKSDDSKTRQKLNQYLERELVKIRSRQLHMLCDSFQLCYNDFL